MSASYWGSTQAFASGGSCSSSTNIDNVSAEGEAGSEKHVCGAMQRGLVLVDLPFGIMTKGEELLTQSLEAVSKSKYADGWKDTGMRRRADWDDASW